VLAGRSWDGDQDCAVLGTIGAGVLRWMGEKFETIPPRREAVPATDFISVERKFSEVCVFARPLAELVAPPTMRHHAETSSTMITDLGLPHHALAQQFKGISLRWQPAEQKKAMETFSPTIAPTANSFARAKRF
jgi:hypothetical protein